MNKQQRSGFTIAELLVVISVMVILVAITASAYKGIQERASDTSIRESASKFASLIELMSTRDNKGYMIKGGRGSTTPATDTGCVDGVGGYQGINYSLTSANYKCTVGDALVSAGYIQPDFFKDLPPNKYVSNIPEQLFLTQTCSNGVTYLFYYQQSPSSADQTKYNNLINTPGLCLSSKSSIDGRGMVGFIKLDVL